MTRFRVLLLTLLALTVALPAVAETPPASERVGELTLEEKAALTTGATSWETFAVERLGIPAAWMADGPVGLRTGVDYGSLKEKVGSLPVRTRIT